MREQTLILIGIKYLRQFLTEVVTLEQDSFQLKMAHLDIENAQRDAEIDSRERQLREVYFPLIQVAEQQLRPEFEGPIGQRLYHSRVDGQGEHFFAIILDVVLHDYLSNGGFLWLDHLKKIAEPHVDRGLIEYRIKTSDLSKPRTVSGERVVKLQGFLDWVKKLPSDPDDCLITVEQARFIGLNLATGSFHYYQVMPE